MRIIRFLSAGTIHYGTPVDASTAFRLDRDPLTGLRSTAQRLPIDKLLAPIVPADILCVGLNYRQHAEEFGNPIPTHPVLFMKGGNALNNPLDPILIPRSSDQVDYEAELAVVIARTARNVPADRALDYVLGYTCANDVSARNWQKDKELGGGQWVRAKSFDTFCPLGPCIVTPDELPDPNALRIRTLLNGQVMQDHTTADMIFSVPRLIAELSATMTLRPGTVILTGTPSGVGFARTPPVFLQPGDTVVIDIEKIGQLQNPVAREP